MGRGKLSMKLISNEKSRKTTFLKREKSLMRKAYELSTLCDVRTCVFVYGPYSGQNEDQSPNSVHTWPPCRDQVNDMISSYKANCLQKRTRKAFGLLDFFSDRKKKIEVDMSKLRKDVAEARFPKWEERLEYLLEDELRVVLVELDMKIEATKRRIDIITQNNYNLDDELEGISTQTQNILNMKQKQYLIEDQNYYNMLIGSCSSAAAGIETPQQAAAIIPFQYHHHHHQMETTSIVPMLQQMDHHHHDNNLSQFNFFGGSSSAPDQFNHGNNCFQSPNFYSNYNNPVQNEMIMDQNPQFCSMCHYGGSVGATHSIMPLPYMQLTDDQMMLAAAACASKSAQMGLNMGNIASSNQPNHIIDHHLDNNNYLDFEYFMKPNFSN